jgi:hypothetical protein
MTVSTWPTRHILGWQLVVYNPPKAIDFIQRFPDGTTSTMQGIYEIDGDTLRISLQLEETRRPGSFFDNQGLVQRLTLVRRKS